MPIVHFLPFEVRHKAEKQLIPKAEGGPDAEDVEAEADGQKQGQKVAVLKGKRGKEPTAKEKEANEQAKMGGEGAMAGEEDTDANNPARYPCPVYKTSARAGALSTTGQSTNYILSISMPIDANEHPAEHWTLRGAAVLTMRDD